MTTTHLSKPTFESRLIPQSREWEDQNGTVYYEHNSWLEIGEKVAFAGSETELTVVKSRYRNPLMPSTKAQIAITGFLLIEFPFEADSKS